MSIYRHADAVGSTNPPANGEIHVPHEAGTLLSALFEPEDTVRVRLIESWTQDGRKANEQHWTRLLSAAPIPTPGLWSIIDRHARGYRCNVFFGVCPRFAAQDGFDFSCQFRVVRTLWTELDDAKPEGALERCRKAGLPDPSIAVSSGRGSHLYWMLGEPWLIDDAPEPVPIFKQPGAKGRHYRVIGGEEVPVDLERLVSPKGRDLQGVLAGIGRAVGGDHVFDLARSLRLPGTMNRKEERLGREPVPCTLAWCEPGRRYSVEDFARWKADLPDPTRSKNTSGGESQPTDDDYTPTLAWDDLAPRQLARFDQLLAASADAEPGERSEADFALLCFCVRAGLDPEEVWDHVADAGKFGEKGQGYFARSWRRAVHEVAHEDDAIKDILELPTPHRDAAANVKACQVECEARADGPPAVVSARDPFRAAYLFVVNRWTDGEGRRLLCFCRQAYWAYDGRRWRERDIERVRGGLWRWLREGCVERGKDGGHSAFRPTKGFVDGVENALRGQCLPPGDGMEPPCWLDGRPSPGPRSLVAFANGLLDLDAMTLHGHTPLWFSTACLPHGYDPSAGCPNWLRFLDEVSGGDGDWIDRLGEWFGYNLTIDNSQQKAAFFVGPRRSGKSTTANALAEVVGKDNVGATSFTDMGSSFGLEDLVGMSAAILPDAHLGRDADTTRVLERLKSITGNDPMRINPKGKKAFTASLHCRFTVATNVLPRLPDASAAMRPRLLVFPFDRSFAGKEDHGLWPRLLGELPGITNWSLAGLRRLRERGRLSCPAAGERILAQFERLSSPIQGFLDDCCVLGEEAQVPAEDLRAAWAGWCEDSGVYPGSEEQFGVNLRSVAPKAEKARPWVTLPDGKKVRRYVYSGIGLTEEAAQAVKARRLRHR